jgi:hypothetical protein
MTFGAAAAAVSMLNRHPDKIVNATRKRKARDLLFIVVGLSLGNNGESSFVVVADERCRSLGVLRASRPIDQTDP